MGHLIDDIDQIIDDNRLEGKTDNKIATRLIQAGLKLALGAGGFTQAQQRIILDMRTNRISVEGPNPGYKIAIVPEAMPSSTRIEEWLDYASCYGDYDETTPDGTPSSHDVGKGMNPYRRQAIVVLKKVLGIIPESVNHRFPNEPDESTMRVALIAARDKFIEYAAHHDAKGTLESGQKAQTNVDMAEMCNAALSAMPENAPETPQEADLALPTPPRVRDIVKWLQAKSTFARRADMTEHANALDELVRSIDIGLVDEPEIDFERALRLFYADCHNRNVKAGWWSDLVTGQPKVRSVGELFMLMVTELWEAYDAYVTMERDDKLPHLPGLGVELGDLQIRFADFCGALADGRIVEESDALNPGDAMFQEVGSIAQRYERIRKTAGAVGTPETGDPVEPQDVASMIFEKLAYNETRADHQIANRKLEGGKQT